MEKERTVAVQTGLVTQSGLMATLFKYKLPVLTLLSFESTIITIQLIRTQIFNSFSTNSLFLGFLGQGPYIFWTKDSSYVLTISFQIIPRKLSHIIFIFFLKPFSICSFINNFFVWFFLIVLVRTQLESPVQKIYGHWPKKPLNNEFVENELEIQVLMSWIVIIVDLKDNKVRTGSLYLKKVALGPVQGDQFLLVFRIRLPVRSILLPSFLSPSFWAPFLSGSLLYFILSSSSSFHLPRVDSDW